MPQEFKIEIISPDKTVFLGSTEEVLLPCYEGQITVLKDHIPLITFLRPGVIKIDKNEDFYVEDGTVEFSDNNLLVLSTSVQSLKKRCVDKNKQIRRAFESLFSTVSFRVPLGPKNDGSGKDPF